MMMKIMLLIKITIVTIINGYYEPSSMMMALHTLSYLVFKKRRRPYEQCIDKARGAVT